jgi:hypothetical protein
MERKDELGGFGPWEKDATRLPAIVDAIESANASPMRVARSLARTYWDWPMLTDASRGDTYSDPNQVRRETDRTLGEMAFNLSREIIDALCARVCRTLSCKIQTVGGDAALRSQAKNMTRLIEALNDQCDTRMALERAAKDACYGRGFGAVLVDWDEVAKEITLDQLDMFSVFFLVEEGQRNPAHMYLKRAIPREYLQEKALAMHKPGLADKISGLPVYHPDTVTGVDPSALFVADTVKLYEGWKTARGELKGRKAEVLEGGLVFDAREYPHDCHQVVLVKLFPDYRGPGGWAIGRGVAPFHRFQNDLLGTIDASLRGAIPRIVKRTETNATPMGTIPWEVVDWDGPSAPQVEVPDTVSPQVFSWLQELRQGSYNAHGISQSMSAGQMPNGVTSGQAIRDYAGFADDRVQSPSEMWKRPWIDVAKAFVALGSEHFRDNGVLVAAPGSDFLEEIKWKDVDMTKNRYRFRFSIASGLVGTGPYKIQQMNDLQTMGLAGPAQMADATADAFPDTAAFVDGIAAPYRLAERMVDMALEGRFEPPSATCGQDLLNNIQQIGTHRMCQVELDGTYSRAAKDLLRKLLRAAQRKTAPPLPPVNPMQPAAAIAPGMIQGPASPAIARNQYEAASLAAASGQQPPPPQG